MGLTGLYTYVQNTGFVNMYSCFEEFAGRAFFHSALFQSLAVGFDSF